MNFLSTVISSIGGKRNREEDSESESDAEAFAPILLESTNEVIFCIIITISLTQQTNNNA